MAEPSDALLSLYDAHVEQVYSYFHRRCGDRTVAEELTSETFLSALRSLHRAQPQSADAAWLIGIARHKLVDHWRRREREGGRCTSRPTRTTRSTIRGTGRWTPTAPPPSSTACPRTTDWC